MGTRVVLERRVGVSGQQDAERTRNYMRASRYLRGLLETMMWFVQAAIDAINNAQVDLIAITGDFVDHWPSTATVLATDWLSQLHTKRQPGSPDSHAEEGGVGAASNRGSGMVACLGNHDYQKPESFDVVSASLERAST